MRSFIAPNDPVLSKIAEAIKVKEITSVQTQNIIKEMLNVAYGEQKDRSKPLLVGLAAPQLGISKRIILVDVLANGKGIVGEVRIFINPEITYSSKGEEEWYEGCYSTDKVCGIVKRPQKIKIKALNEKGEEIEERYRGYTARIFQHEIDHLNGKEFIAHIIDDNNLHWVEENEFPLYRDKQAWRNWPHKYPREKWKKIKGI